GAIWVATMFVGVKYLSSKNLCCVGRHRHTIGNADPVADVRGGRDRESPLGPDTSWLRSRLGVGVVTALCSRAKHGDLFFFPGGPATLRPCKAGTWFGSSTEMVAYRFCREVRCTAKA